MAGHRISRINADAQRELANILRDLKDPRIPTMTSVMAVRVTEDLKFAKVYVSMFGTDEQKKEGLKGLKSAAGHIRRQLASRLDLRQTPELIFEQDDSIEHLSRIDTILKGIHIPEDQDDEQDE